MEKQELLQRSVLTRFLRGNSPGFTLIEFILVIVIIAVLSIAYVTFLLPNNGAGIRLSNTANQLVADIRLAQSLAMSLNQRRQVNFLTSAYSVTDTNNKAAWLNSDNIAFHPMIRLTSATSSKIMFNGRGVPYSDESTPLATLFQVVLQAGVGNQRTVSILPITGSVGVTNP